MSFQLERKYDRHILRPISYRGGGTSKSPGTTVTQNSSSSSSWWTATTHIFIGSGNRIVPTSWPPHRFSEDPANIPDDNQYDTKYDDKSAQVKAPEDVTYNIYEPTKSTIAGDTNNMPRPLLVVKRYIPTYQAAPQDSHSSPGVTLLMLPGMGLPKEMFEPMIEALLQRVQSNEVAVEEIWALDMPMCGQTALKNPIGYLYGNEKDITRDILMFVTGYLPLHPRQDLPESLPFRTPGSSGPQAVRPNLHMVAHSLGAQAAMLAAAHAPNIFASLSAMDPAMIPGGKTREAFAKLPKDLFCMQIEGHHASREALAAAIKANRRACGWDERVAAVFVDRGAVDTGNGGVRLTAHPRLEWALYYDKETPTQCYDRLKDITTPFNAIMPTKPFAVTPKRFEADVATMKQRTRITWLPKTTHQLPFEQVDKTAQLVADWLTDMSDPKTKAHF